MRHAWKTALEANKESDAFLLLNDDVILDENFIEKLIRSHDYCLKKKSQPGITSVLQSILLI